MNLAIVEKQVISTIKHPSLEGRTLFQVRPVDVFGNPNGDSFVTIDAVKAKPGMTVLVTVEGGAAMAVLGVEDAPVQSVIVAIVDRLKLDESQFDPDKKAMQV